MANPTLNWTINRDRGTISFGRLLPLAGNTYDIETAGGDGTSAYTYYVMDDGGEVCLAKSATESGRTTIAFTGSALRDRFAKDWHEVRTFHCTVSDGTNTIAEGDLSVTWNPVWTEPSAGEAYSMRGPQGVGISAVEFVSVDASGNFVYQFRLTNGGTAQFTSPRGAMGPAANANYVKYADGEYYQLKVYKNRFGEAVVELDQSPVSEVPGMTPFVTIADNQTVTGNKTFTGDTRVPTIVSTDDSSTMASSTAWVTNKIAAWWNSVKAAAITFAGQITASAGIVGDVTGDVTGDVNGIDFGTDEAGDLTFDDKLVRSHYVGEVFMFATTDSAHIPSGTLPCDGSAVSRTEYATLFSVIGTIYGSGDGTSTFNIPNMTDRIMMCGSALGASTVQTAVSHTHQSWDDNANNVLQKTTTSGGAKSVDSFNIACLIQAK